MSRIPTHLSLTDLSVVDFAGARGRADPARGRVSIVGAGPGDPELLTVRAVRRLEEAEVLVHDRLIGPGILDLAPAAAERIYAGKCKARHARTQDEINAILLDRARRGRRVVRLKGGDPFIFGRGGEELAFLRDHGVDAEVVPGITAATGCAAATGIPLTHRDHVQSVVFVTGHASEGEPDLDWQSLARRNQTVVVYMGVSTADLVSRRLIEHGLDPATPAAVIENGTLPGQKVAVGTVADLPRLVAWNDIRGPAVLVLGTVVGEAFAAAPVVPRVSAA